METSCDAGIICGAVFAAPGVLLKAFSTLLKTSAPVSKPFGHLLCFNSLNVGKHLRIGFLVSFNIFMSLSRFVSSSRDSCVCVVVVDLEACREPSKNAVAVHATEQSVGGGRGQSQTVFPKYSAAGGWQVLRKHLGGLWNLLKAFWTLLKTSEAVCGPFRHLLGFNSLNVGKHLRIGFLVSFSVSMSLSLFVSSSLDSCVCAVVVDLEAGREPSKDAVALHATEKSAAGVGRTQSQTVFPK